MSERAFVIMMTVIIFGLILALGVSLGSGAVHPKIVPLGFGAVIILGIVLYEVWRATR